MLQEKLENFVRTMVSFIDEDVKISSEIVSSVLIISINSEKMTNLIVGKQGQNLNSVQTLLEVFFYKNHPAGSDDGISYAIVDVQNFRKNKIVYALDLLETSVKDAVEKNSEVVLPIFDSFARKVVHTVVANKFRGKLYTESRGEGYDRKLFLVPGIRPEKEEGEI